MLIKDPPVQITERVLMLGTSLYPLYLVQDQHEAALVEGGIGAMGPMVREQMQQSGIDGKTVKQIVVPHAHPDHVMAIPLFRELFPGAAVTASAQAARTLSIDKAIAYFCQIDAALTDSLSQAGIIGPQHHPKPLTEKSIAVDRLIGDGDTIAVGQISFDVLATPGHSECSLSFHDPRSDVLLISDAAPYYLPEHHCWWPDYFGGCAAYLDSLDRLAGLHAEVLCLGHNGAIRGAQDVAAYFAEVISATKQYHQRILDETEAGKSVRQIAEALGSEVHEKSPLLPLDFFQKNCGLLVKHSLRHEGLLPDK